MFKGKPLRSEHTRFSLYTELDGAKDGSIVSLLGRRCVL